MARFDVGDRVEDISAETALPLSVPPRPRFGTVDWRMPVIGSKTHEHVYTVAWEDGEYADVVWFEDELMPAPAAPGREEEPR